jgi:hypothetical protein
VRQAQEIEMQWQWQWQRRGSGSGSDRAVGNKEIVNLLTLIDDVGISVRIEPLK